MPASFVNLRLRAKDKQSVEVVAKQLVAIGGYWEGRVVLGREGDYLSWVDFTLNIEKDE